jgi:hypothetical protein
MAHGAGDMRTDAKPASSGANPNRETRREVSRRESIILLL